MSQESFVAGDEIAAASGLQGVKELKELLLFVLSMTEATVSSLEDGKFGIGDAMKFLGVLKKAGPAMQGIGLIPAELKDLSPEERDEVEKYIAANFDLKNDVLEAAIEGALDALLSIADLGKIFQRK